MKYLRTYEQINKEEPQIGDYVLCDESFFSEPIASIVNDNIGQYVAKSNDNFFIVFYEDLKDLNIKHAGYMTAKDENGNYHESVALMAKWEVKYWSPNRDELEIFISSKKYNL